MPASRFNLCEVCGQLAEVFHHDCTGPETYAGRRYWKVFANHSWCRTCAPANRSPLPPGWPGATLLVDVTGPPDNQQLLDGCGNVLRPGAACLAVFIETFLPAQGNSRNELFNLGPDLPPGDAPGPTPSDN